MDADARVASLGLKLPPAAAAVGLFKGVVIVGNLAYVSGHIPFSGVLEGGKLDFFAGKVGVDVDAVYARKAARQVALAILATLKSGLGGTLRPVVRVVNSFGMVNCTQDFTGHPAVLDGYSEVLRDVFGPDAGVGARAAVGMSSLPMNATVEVTAVFEVKTSACEGAKCGSCKL